MIYTPNASAFMLETRRLLFMESCWNYVNYVCHSRMNNVDGEAARGKEFAKDFRCREFSIVREFRSIFGASCEDFSCRLTPSSASCSTIFTLPVSTPAFPVRADCTLINIHSNPQQFLLLSTSIGAEKDSPISI